MRTDRHDWVATMSIHRISPNKAARRSGVVRGRYGVKLDILSVLHGSFAAASLFVMILSCYGGWPGYYLQNTLQ